jgi:uncharacterized protein YdiU (UPF0061 family)
MDSRTHIPFDNSYARLPERFYRRLAPTPVAQPELIRVNRPLADLLRIDADWLASGEGVAMVAGNSIPEGAEPLAAAYAGHQFGSYNPQLGDGRAILLGEVIGSDGERYDLQLKGSGRTPWSRGGDGRSPLGPVLREYLVSEAMHTLGVPTTRALAAVTTGERVRRDTPLPGAVMARVASSHIRIGTFQYFAMQGDREALEALSDHVIQRHYPGAAEAEVPALALLQAVIEAQAELVTHWQLLGFIHGVMNTDNMLLSGQTIDYGPCAFMDAFHPETVFSSIDHAGRYAFRNQPGIAHWNLACLAQALLPLLDPEQERAVAMAQAAVDSFPGRFEAAYSRGLQAKLGLSSERDTDRELVESLFRLMAEQREDFTLCFRYLAERAGALPEGALEAVYRPSQALLEWLPRWQQRCNADPGDPEQRRQRMLTANPLYIPRNHLVEAAIEAATARTDFSVFHRLVDRLTAAPCATETVDPVYALPPSPEQEVTQTFCGT